MAQFEMTPELKDIFIARIQYEHGQTVCSNFIFDILLTASQQRVIALEQALKEANDQNASLRTSCDSAEQRIKTIMEQHDNEKIKISKVK